MCKILIVNIFIQLFIHLQANVSTISGSFNKSLIALRTLI